MMALIFFAFRDCDNCRNFWILINFLQIIAKKEMQFLLQEPKEFLIKKSSKSKLEQCD